MNSPCKVTRAAADLAPVTTKSRLEGDARGRDQMAYSLGVQEKNPAFTEGERSHKGLHSRNTYGWARWQCWASEGT